MSTRSQFDQETALEETEDGYEGILSAHWNIGDNPNGGYMLSCALAAIGHAVDHPHPLSVTTHYLRPGIGDAPFVIHVEIIKRGRTLSNALATMVQDGKTRLTTMAAFGDLAAGTGIDTEITVEAPDLPPPDTCPLRTGDLQGIDLPITERLEVRLHPEHRPGTRSAAEMAGWIRFKDGRPTDALALNLFADAFPPSPLTRLGLVGWVPTLELTTHVRRVPAPGWIKARFATADLAAGRMIESGMLWDENDELVAQSRQLGLVMPG